MEHQDSQFREIFEKSPIGILFYDKNGITVNANNSALKMLGFPRLDDVLGHNLFDNHYISEKKDELLNKGIIKFQAPLNLEKIKDF
ncbi:MAG: PAS domain S-box protein [Methanobacterium sp.]